MKIALILFLLFQETATIVSNTPPAISSRLNPGEWIALAVFLFSIASAFAWLIFRSGRTYEAIEDMKPLVAKIPGMAIKVDLLWSGDVTSSNSPTILNEKGKKILKDSGIREFTDKYFTEIFEQVKKLKPANAYQAQEFTIAVVDSYSENDKCKNDLEIAAFDSGSDVKTILLVAAIDIRDKIIEKLEFKKEDIDRHDPNNTQSK